MSCMCGDLCCWSCGPAQGNWRCPICGEWATDPCEHMDEEGRGILPEFKELADRVISQENAVWDVLAEEQEEA